MGPEAPRAAEQAEGSQPRAEERARHLHASGVYLLFQSLALQKTLENPAFCCSCQGLSMIVWIFWFWKIR